MAGEPGKGALWGGRILSAVPVVLMTMSGVMKLTRGAQVVEGWGKSGYPLSTLAPIGVAELLCVLLYLVPRTAVLGAILATGYLGGAVATHVRAGENGLALVPFLLGVVAWGGLWLRDPRVRALLPLR